MRTDLKNADAILRDVPDADAAQRRHAACVLPQRRLPHAGQQVLDFYDFRDTRPQRVYPHGKFDDLPPRDRANVDTVDAPFDRTRGQAPPLTPAEERDIIAFLAIP